MHRHWISSIKTYQWRTRKAEALHIRRSPLSEHILLIEPCYYTPYHFSLWKRLQKSQIDCKLVSIFYERRFKARFLSLRPLVDHHRFRRRRRFSRRCPTCYTCHKEPNRPTQASTVPQIGWSPWKSQNSLRFSASLFCTIPFHVKYSRSAKPKKMKPKRENRSRRHDFENRFKAISQIP